MGLHSLGQKELERIVDLQVERAQKRLAERHLTLRLSSKAKAFLVKEGFDPLYGARPLKRAVQRYVLDPLAVRLLDGSIHPGEVVVVDQDGTDALTFKPA
ncbi:MAG: hypothetical protein HYY57_01300 [Candidatus Omnitrophica bacterium]|nr:hypothetical protein [Candidatus Omnitrophota bacterium]